MKKKKETAMSMSKDGQMSRPVTVELRITKEEERMADALYIDFRESVALNNPEKARSFSFTDYLAMLLKQAIAKEIQERCPDYSEDV